LLFFNNVVLSCFAIAFKLSHDDWQSVSNLFILRLISSQSTFEQRLKPPKSECKSVVSGDFSRIIEHKCCSNECLWTVSLTSGTLDK
jgi:hypothetical protein